MNVKVFILAAGGEPQWKGHQPRQLLDIAGEPLIHRTIRLVKTFRIEPIIVTNKHAIIASVGETSCFHPESECWIYDTILSTQNLWNEDLIIFLVGDFLFHTEVISKIFTSSCTCCWVGRWGIFALVVHRQDFLSFKYIMDTGRRQANLAKSDELQQVMGDFERFYDFRDDLCDFDYVEYLQPTLDRIGNWARQTKGISPYDTVLVCLAAGDGNRLGLDYPKSLLDFDGMTLLETELEAFYRRGIRQAIICVGFKQELVRERLGSAYREMSISYVENLKFESTGAGYSLWLAKEHWQGRPAIVLESDLLIHPDLVFYLWGQGPNAGLVDETRTSLKGDIVLNSETFKMIWPAKSHRCGVVLPIFQLSTESNLQSYLNEGEIIEPLNKIPLLYFTSTHGLPWIEIDTPNDLRKAKKLWASELKSLYFSL